jgi:hypothetical protein
MRDRDRGAVTLEELDGQAFATVAEVAGILRADPRTIRRRIADSSIPAVRAADWRIPVAWLRQQAQGVPALASSQISAAVASDRGA